MDTANESHLTRASIFARLGSSGPRERERAWSEFRDRYAPIIAGFAAKCGASRQDIDDIIQDVLTNFLGASGEFVYDPAKGRFRVQISYGWFVRLPGHHPVRRGDAGCRGPNILSQNKPSLSGLYVR